MHKLSITLLPLALTLSACSLIPDYQQPDAPIPGHYPRAAAYAEANATGSTSDWHTVFQDESLQQLIRDALVNNRDLRAAALNVEAFQAQYRIQRADLLPAVSANSTGTRQRQSQAVADDAGSTIQSSYSATLGISAYELDLFGRIRSLSEQALQTYLASEEARRSIQITLVANVANAYLTWRADQELLALTQKTLAADTHSLHLTSRSNQISTVSTLDVYQAQTRVENARANLARYQRLVAQDLNNLTLLVGATVPDSLPSRPLASNLVAQIPAGLPSNLLQRRPDILQAEYQLKAANANIGAARAAFFPSISLTANAGSSSTELSGLFKSGTGGWFFQPQINLPIFNAGSLRANLNNAKLQKAILVAQYEKSIQTAFQEVSNGLTARKTYSDQLNAQHNLVEATQHYYDLAEHRHRLGLDSNLIFLDAQRLLFNSQQTLINDRLTQLIAEVNLYTALGGTWKE
ncbi:efflux transporter outer membrane subunit [Pseudomonas sp. B329]|uniref:efflux transporter outer membrane subunit n=1 Tax=Pseudomonas sp. B329 TaxID=1553459 RepID=UPI0020032415|nr:efflux transporter outer membrane subunit [Pseudomonas sp. B329]MCK3863828.1 efflux transporter outer membrane subunit [Pseudomonas sp. B329]